MNKNLKLTGKDRSRFGDWIRNNKLYDLEEKDLEDFYVKKYCFLKVQEKIAIMKYYRETKQNLLAFNLDKLTEIKKYYTNRKREEAKKGWKNYLENNSLENINKTNRQRIDKIRNKRIEKLKIKYPNKTDKELLKESYSEGIITKGKIIAKALLLDMSLLNNQDFQKLSGYAKKINFSKLTVEEKEKKRLNWMHSNLKNKNVRNIILKNFPEFLELNLEVLSDLEIIKWYCCYQSLRCLQTFKGKPLWTLAKYKHGWFYSIKQNKKLFFRSSYEEQILKNLENNSKVLEYETEPFRIKYEKDNKIRHYIPDIYVLYEQEPLLLEIKPSSFVEDFWKEKGNYFIKNIKSFLFFIVTEKELEEKIFNEYVEKNIVDTRQNF